MYFWQKRKLQLNQQNLGSFDQHVLHLYTKYSILHSILNFELISVNPHIINNCVHYKMYDLVYAASPKRENTGGQDKT